MLSETGVHPWCLEPVSWSYGRIPRGSRVSCVSPLWGEFSVAVECTSDWRVRILSNGEFRCPKGWWWALKLAYRALMLGGPSVLALTECLVDIGFAGSVEELRWARNFVAKA